MTETGEEVEMACKEEVSEDKEKVVLMWGYLPGATPQRSPLLSPVKVTLPESFTGDRWKDVCGGGCGFAMALSEAGKLITWGSTDDQGQSYLASGRHEEIPEAFALPGDLQVVKAAGGWSHCITITDHGQVYAWGWKECVPSRKVSSDQFNGDQSNAAGDPSGEQFTHGEVAGDQPNNETIENGSETEQNGSFNRQDNSTPHSRSHVSNNSDKLVSGSDSKSCDDNKKRRRLSAAKHAQEGSTAVESDEPLSANPCLVTLGSGVRITAVAAGGRHTLALSDVGKVWGWGYGGEGQLGLGSRIKTVSSPHPIPCIDSIICRKEQPVFSPKRKINSVKEFSRTAGSSVKAIACGGRHSAVITDTGALLTFGWGLHGQCGQGGTDDELSPTCVSSLLGIQIQGIAAGLWHTVCTSADGGVYAFGGNQFGQLGTGSDHVEVLGTLDAWTPKPRDDRRFGQLYQRVPHPSPSRKIQLLTFVSLSVEDALASLHWKQTMDEEAATLRSRGTWELVARTVMTNVVSCRWVFTLKRKPYGTVDRYRTRLVVKRFSQQYGVDNAKMCSLVARLNSIHIILSVSINLFWDVCQLDVKNAFLYGGMIETVFMEQPLGYVA